MTSNQIMHIFVHPDMSDGEIEALADALAASPAGRKAAGRAIGRGKKRITEETRRARSVEMARRNRERAKSKGESTL